MYKCRHVQCPFFLSEFNGTLIFTTYFLKINKYVLNLMKIGPVGAEFFHADGQTDRHDEANSRFSQICESAWKHYVMSACLKELSSQSELINGLTIHPANGNSISPGRSLQLHICSRQTTHRFPFVIRCRMWQFVTLWFNVAAALDDFLMSRSSVFSTV